MCTSPFSTECVNWECEGVMMELLFKLNKPIIPVPFLSTHGKTKTVSWKTMTVPSSPKSGRMNYCASYSVAAVPMFKLKGFHFHPTPPPPPPQFALLCLLFVLSTAIGAILSLALLSLPTFHYYIYMAFGKLGKSMDELSKVVSEEVTGTLVSLRLSVLEINELTQRLTNLRQKISASPSRKRK